jgi:hypothetical protein
MRVRAGRPILAAVCAGVVAVSAGWALPAAGAQEPVPLPDLWSDPTAGQPPTTTTTPPAIAALPATVEDAGAQAAPPAPAAGSPDTAMAAAVPRRPNVLTYIVREITFPVGDAAARYSPDWHAPRDGGARQHLGTDIFAPKLTPVLAARSGVIVRGRSDAGGISGNYVALRDDEGWEYLYIHLNNDTPGSDDNLNPGAWILAPGIGIGSRVERGQQIGYVGDSGNAENVPSHLHFEVRRPAPGGRAVAVNGFPSLRTAQGRPLGDQCEWSRSPAPDGSSATESGYRTAFDDGGLFTYGASRFLGSPGGLPLEGPVVGGAAPPGADGYWLVASDGGVFSYGSARFHGSAGGLDLVAPVVDMAPTPTGRGYWLVAADGGVFSYGDARFHGSAGGLDLVAPIVAMAATPTGRGYWLVAADGGVFSYGDARFFGSLGGARAEPVIDVAAAPDGRGYWLLTEGAGIHPFGSVAWHGSVQSAGLCEVRTGLSLMATGDGAGYWILTTDGQIRPFGSARPFGDIRSVQAVPWGQPVALLPG